MNKTSLIRKAHRSCNSMNAIEHAKRLEGNKQEADVLHDAQIVIYEFVDYIKKGEKG